MSIHYIPMLISGTLCLLLSIITWLLRRRENINRVFSFFALALALDSFSYFLWFQFGAMENIKVWMRVIYPAGILVPIGFILFFFAFTGYDKRLDEKVLGIKAGHVRIAALLIFGIALALTLFTHYMIKIPDSPKNIWDTQIGLYGKALMPLFALIVFYMLAMAFKSYRRDDNKPRKRFIVTLAIGAILWVLLGYAGILLFSSTNSVMEQSFYYLGTAFMAMVYFVAIVNYQSDKERELNLNLQGKVEQLQNEILERERVEKLAREQQEKLIQSDKMASVGILVSGVAHEINNPNNYMLLNSNNLADIWKDLKPFLDKYCREHGDFTLAGMPYSEMSEDVTMMIKALNEGPERIRKIVLTLKDYARKDAGNINEIVHINAVIEASTTILSNLIKNATNHFTVTCPQNLPAIKGNFQQLEQVVINLLSNACQALEDKTKAISIAAEFDGPSNTVKVFVRDEGKGISPEDMKFIMDPFFTTKRDKGGTGLGLSISYKIVHDHKGELKFESEPGKGTTAVLLLPVPAT